MEKLSKLNDTIRDLVDRQQRQQQRQAMRKETTPEKHNALVKQKPADALVTPSKDGKPNKKASALIYDESMMTAPQTAEVP